MTPHLHPRSHLTTSLFGTTLLVSFLVVGMPHIVPCPAPRVKFADSDFEITKDGKRRRRRPADDSEENNGGEKGDLALPVIAEGEKLAMRRSPHECPVPKLRGIIGEVLGFKKEETAEKAPRPRIETTNVSRPRKDGC